MEKELKILINKLKEYTKRAYFVGGCVRDELLGLIPKDIDIEVFDVEQEVLEKILNDCAKELRYKEVGLIGKSYGVYKLGDLDISIPRRETKVGEKHTDFDVAVHPFISVREAAIRRDFTINSIYKNIFNGEYIDEFEGKKDLERKIIKHINKNTFIEDSLRIFRAAQFAVRFNFEIDKETIELAKTINVLELPYERVYTETQKAIEKTENFYRYFKILFEVLGKETFFKSFKFDYDEQLIKEVFINTKYTKIEDKTDFVFAFLHTECKSKEKSILTKRQRRLCQLKENSKSYFEHFLYFLKTREYVSFLEEAYGFKGLEKTFKSVEEKLLTTEEIKKATNLVEGKELGLAIRKSRELSFIGVEKESILRILSK